MYLYHVTIDRLWKREEQFSVDGGRKTSLSEMDAIAECLDDVPLSKRIRLSQRAHNSTQETTDMTKRMHHDCNENTDRVERFLDERRHRKECVWIENVPAQPSDVTPLEDVSALIN